MKEIFRWLRRMWFGPEEDETVSDDREDLREVVRALLKVVATMIPIWEWQINMQPTSDEKTVALNALEEAQRELANLPPP